MAAPIIQKPKELRKVLRKMATAPEFYKDLRGFHDHKSHAYKFKVINTKEKVFGKLDRVKSEFKTTDGWKIAVKFNKMEKKERNRIKREFEKARLKSPKETYEGFYDREGQVFYIYKITYPHEMVKPENVNYNVYSIKKVNENGVTDIVEGDYDEDKHMLVVNDDFEIKIIKDNVPEAVKEHKPNAVFKGPMDHPAVAIQGYYDDEDPKSIKFYALGNKPSKHEGKHQPDAPHGKQHEQSHHAKEQHGKQQHHEQPHHGNEQHGKEHHGKEQHGKEHHGKEQHGKEHHGKEQHGKEHHEKEHHGKDKPHH